MASEEIELNPYLENLGMEVVETDLGERMVQLTHTRPSHLIAPAIHLTKENAAEVFGTEPTVEAIQSHARASLRKKFIEASVGISGANMAIAETGTLVLVTNEGNADLTTTLPPVHIALFGIDKLVASLDDAVAVLRMLPRSGTGQIMSSYVNWITGPSRSADIEQSLTIGVHGPREMHCVILDNGREKMLDDPIFRDALTCVRCGACSNACPPFMAVSGHQFGHIYNGPIGLVLSPFHHGVESADLPNTLCVQCNACQEICPVDIPLPRQILEHRRRGRKSMRKRAMVGVWKRPELADKLIRAAAPLTALAPGRPLDAAEPHARLDPLRPAAAGVPARPGQPPGDEPQDRLSRLLPDAAPARLEERAAPGARARRLRGRRPARHRQLLRVRRHLQPRMAAGRGPARRVEARRHRQDRLRCRGFRQPGLPDAHRRGRAEAADGPPRGPRPRARRRAFGLTTGTDR